MYKKITHTIVEEHFDHPIASQIKKSLGRSKLVTADVFSELKFKNDVISYFTTYDNYINSLINATAGTDEDLIIAFDDFFKTAWVDNLGNMTKPLYVTEFGERLNEAMRLIATGVLLSIQSIRTGKDSGFAFSRLQFALNDLAQNLNNFNVAWLYPTINTLLTNLITDILSRVKAKLAKNNSLDQQLASKISTTWQDFAKTFADGITSQQPDRFTKTVTMSESFNHNDIM